MVQIRVMQVRGHRLAGASRHAILIGTFLAIVALPALARDAASQIRGEIQRLQDSLKSHPAEPAEIGSAVERELQSASNSLGAGRLYLSLDALARAVDLMEGLRFSNAKKADVEKGGLPAFQSAWEKVSLDLAAFEKDATANNWDRSPAAVRALAESARTRSRPLLEGGLGFATATAPSDGLFYLGQAEGEAAFARFCAGLEFSKTASFPGRSLLPELQALQERTNAAFQPPRSIEQHPRFIALNSTIKLAHELDAAKLYAGALYQYLEATRHFGMLDAAPLDAAGQTAVKKDLEAARRRFSGGKADHSIAQLFLERAAAPIARADASAPSADEWRSARVVLDRVLPAYLAALKAPAGSPQIAGKTVEITLVRWPYT